MQSINIEQFLLSQINANLAMLELVQRRDAMMKAECKIQAMEEEIKTLKETVARLESEKERDDACTS